MSSALTTLPEAARDLREGRTTSVTLVERVLRLADERDGELGVYARRFDEHALAAAEHADAELQDGIDRGPLHGLPVGVKDLIATAEAPTTAQSRVLPQDWNAGVDAPVVSRLRDAGAIVVGKVTTMELGIGIPELDGPFPIPRNPWDTARWPGGSSSGSAAGVAAGFFPLALGSDTGGSIRIPAAYCGITGLAPTYGLVPTAKAVPLSYSLDRIGPMARTAEECGALLNAIAPSPGLSPDARSLEGLRIGVHHMPDSLDDDPSARERLAAALSELEALGGSLTAVDLPYYEQTVAAVDVTCFCEAFAQHRQSLRDRWDDYSATARATFAAGALFSGADYVQAQRMRSLTARKLAGLMQTVDVIVTPTTTVSAPTYDQLISKGVAGVMKTARTSYWSGAGYPALALPIGPAADGLPLSMHVAARPYEESLLVEIGRAYQQHTRWHLDLPPGCA